MDIEPEISREAPALVPRLERGVRGGAPQPGVVGEAEVVVRAEQQHRAPVEQDGGALRPFDQPQPAPQPTRLELGQPLAEVEH